MGKKEVWCELQAMHAVGHFHGGDWQDMPFQWWRWTSNVAQHHVAHGIRSARVRKCDEDRFEFKFVNEPDPAQPGVALDFTISIWRHGKHLDFYVS